MPFFSKISLRANIESFELHKINKKNNINLDTPNSKLDFTEYGYLNQQNTEDGYCCNHSTVCAH